MTTRRVPVPRPDFCGNPYCPLCFQDVEDRDAPAEASAGARDLTVWRTADGRNIPLREMTDRHLANTIAYLERRIGTSDRIAWLPALRAEQLRRRDPGTAEVTAVGRLPDALDPRAFEPDLGAANESLLARLERQQREGTPSWQQGRRKYKPRRSERPARAPAPAPAPATWRPADIRITLSATTGPESVTIRPAPLAVDAVMPAKGIPVDDIMDVLRENLIQHETKVQRG